MVATGRTWADSCPMRSNPGLDPEPPLTDDRFRAMRIAHRLLHENSARTLLEIQFPARQGFHTFNSRLFGSRMGTLAAAGNLTESLETNDPLAVLGELSRSIPGRLAGSVIHDLRFFWRD